jgi:hypothetical protein
VTHDVHIRTTDGGIQYLDALSYGVVDGVLMVQVGEDEERSDKVYFSPNYWLQYSVDPYSDDPLDFGFDELDDEGLDEELDEDSYDEDLDEDDEEDSRLVGSTEPD